MHDSLPNTLEAARPRPRLRSRDHFVREFTDLVVLIGAIYALVNLASVRYVVQGPSMQPQFETGQFLVISRLDYLFGTPERGDIVVFHFPNNPSVDYIKRVIGLPGDTVEIYNSRVFVNGVELIEPYINEVGAGTLCRGEWCELNLRENEYYMMGDNRHHSSDSRAFGPVEAKFLVGEALIRYWPLPEWGRVAQIAYPHE